MYCYLSLLGNIKSHLPEEGNPLYWLNGTHRCQVLEISLLKKLTLKRTEKKKENRRGR